jgi:hypothetical protein
LARGANASRAPELRDAALAGTLNRPVCPSCGRAHDANAIMVYADPLRGHWISVALHEDLARWAELEPVAVAAFRTSLETAPEVANTLVRIVFDLDELRERIAIWSAGLDDGVIECVKLDCLRERPLMRGPDQRIRLTAISDDTLTFRIMQVSRPEDARAEFAVPREVADRIAADRVWRERFPALFEPGFVSIDRYLI